MADAETIDTIAAVATSAAEAGIAIVRMSGPSAVAIAGGMFRPARGKGLEGAATHTVRYGTLADENGVMDEVLVTVMRAPRTYTREDVVEIGCHGGSGAAGRILDAVLQRGARPAEPGEFTKRAFLNGRLDLTQAEAVLDVIRAKTDLGLRAGMEHLQGAFSGIINAERNRLLAMLARIEARIDFGEDGVAAIDIDEMAAEADAAVSRLSGLLQQERFGRFMRDGARVALCGLPNVGKSSLLNALLKRERSIVTAVAGTTRDTVEELVDMRGIPVRLIDTAGILKPANVIERKAVRRSRAAAAGADLVVLVFDGSRSLSDGDRRLASSLRRGTVLAVVNKADLRRRIESDQVARLFGRPLEVSARRGSNIVELEERIVSALGGAFRGRDEALMINARHAHKLKTAVRALKNCGSSLKKGLAEEFIAEELRQALLPLDEIVGVRFSEDILEKIFSEFCIGK